MKHATLIVIVILGLAATLAFFLKDAILFVAVLSMMPLFMNSIPWGLAQISPDENEAESAEDYQGTGAGFTRS